MDRSLIVVIPDLQEEYAARIREAAARNGFECRIFGHTADSVPYLADAEVVLGSSTFLAQNTPSLKWFCASFAGVDSLLKEGVFASPTALLTNSSGAYGVTIAEHIVMMLLQILRRQPEYHEHVRNREWIRRLPIRSIHGSRVTFLGTGDIGQETLQRIRSFEPAQAAGVNRSGRNPGMRFDRIVKSTELDSILPETDVLIVSLPGTKETFHMVGERQLKLLPDDAVIINVGRGAVIDQEALEKELRSGRLFAGLDVFETEPLPAESTLWDCPRLVLTPHVAGDTTLPWTRRRIVELFLEDFENYCAGRPLLRLVDREAGY